MCTVTYIPKNEKNFILTSSRDESLYRASSLRPKTENFGDIQVLFPKDGEKGGTWIGVTNNQRTLCLLNGAFEKHIPTNNYVKSRGLVVLDFFQFDKNHTVDNYDLEGIEPFTLIIIDSDKERTLTQLKWDGITKHITILNSADSHIWSSATLYSLKLATHKSKIFYEKITTEANEDVIFNFHHLGTKSEPNLMKYSSLVSPIKTVSITQVIQHQDKASMRYFTITNGKSQLANINYN